MPSYTFRQLAAASVSTAAIATPTLYTAPTGFRALVREIVVNSSDGAAIGAVEVVKGAVVFPYTGDVLTGALSTTLDRRLMLEPGDVLRLNITGAGGGGSTATLLVSGVEISTA